MKVAISACLLGENCRYDGKTKINNAVIEKFKNDEIIPFCPEAPISGTPRQRISVIQKDSKMAVISDESKEDFTDEIIAQADLLCSSHPDLDMIVLKSKSPSCGLGTTPVLSENRELLSFGDGIAASRLKEKYSNIQIVDELSIDSGN